MKLLKKSKIVHSVDFQLYNRLSERLILKIRKKKKTSSLRFKKYRIFSFYPHSGIQKLE